MHRLILNDITAYPWFTKNNISFRGYFIVNNVIYKEENAIIFIQEKLKEFDFKALLQLINGIFSIILCQGEDIIFATDRLRNLPLFYAFNCDCLLISDNANSIYNVLSKVTFNPVSIEEFERNGLYVTGQDTLFNEIKQVQAGEFISYKSSKLFISSNFYFIHAEGKISTKDQKSLTKDFKVTFQNACNNLKIALNNRTAIVPLSGGTDSRMLLFMLHSMNYKNVICYSYGKKTSIECKIAEELATHFGFKWIKVTYTRKLWRGLRKDTFFQKYIEYAGNFTCLPHIQDFLALRLLLEQRKCLPNNYVLLPGHAGAIVGGNLFPEFLQEHVLTYNEIINLIKERTYRSSTDQLTSELNNKIHNYFDPKKCATNAESEAQCHCFSMKERQAKFIVNSVRIYEYFGYEWLLPLCDLEFLEFMKGLPLNMKYRKKFVRDFMGLKNIRSTSDVSNIKKIIRRVNGFPFIGVLAKKFVGILSYFTSSLQISGLFGFREYFKGCMFGDQFFSINDLAKRQYLETLKEKNNETI